MITRDGKYYQPLLTDDDITYPETRYYRAPFCVYYKDEWDYKSDIHEYTGQFGLFGIKANDTKAYGVRSELNDTGFMIIPVGGWILVEGLISNHFLRSDWGCLFDKSISEKDAIRINRLTMLIEYDIPVLEGKDNND